MAGTHKHDKHDDDVTKTFLSALSTTREIRQPIEVREGRKPLPRTADEYEIVYNPETDKDHPYEKWRRNPILRCLVTREIARYLDRRTFITVSVREAIIYCIFLILITIITFGSTPLDMFYFSQAMATLYTKQKFPVEMSRDEDPISIDFYQINTLEHIWFYQNAILDKLFHSFWYTKPDPYASPENTQEYFYENKLIGSPQIRQIRVKNSTCSTVDAMKHMVQTCYGPYTEGNEEKGQIGLITSATAKQNLEWNSPDKTGSMSISGSLATYSGGGYVAILSRHGDDATQLLLQLKSLKWYDRATRALFIEFTIYNGNVNLFCIFKLIFEMPPTGGVIPNHWNYVQKLIRYNDSYDFFVLGCEVVFTIFFFFFTLQKLLEIKTLKSKVFRTFWNYIDLMVLIMCYMTLIFNILLYVSVNDQLPKLVDPLNEKNYASFDFLCNMHILYSYSFAILLAFAFLRLLKYLNIVHAMYQLQSMISRAMRDILSFSILFFYLYFVFAMVGLFLFGSKLEDYKTFPLAVFSLLRSSVGDFNYANLVQADPFIGPLFFFTFIFFCTFILVNIFLAILVSRYEEVRSEVRIGGAKTFIGEMLKLWFLRLLERMECHWLRSQIERKQFEKKIRSPTEAIRHYLRQAGYSELEIELFFKKYDITDSKIAAIDEDRISFRSGEREAPPPLSQKDILRYIVIQKLEYLENHYQAASKLIDEFLNKLTKFEKKQ